MFARITAALGEVAMGLCAKTAAVSETVGVTLIQVLGGRVMISGTLENQEAD